MELLEALPLKMEMNLLVCGANPENGCLLRASIYFLLRFLMTRSGFAAGFASSFFSSGLAASTVFASSLLSSGLGATVGGASAGFSAGAGDGSDNLAHL